MAIDYKRDYLTKDESGYASHIQTLMFIFNVIPVNRVVEYGMGFFSTPFFIENAKKSVFSIEMQSKEWYDKVVAKYKETEKNWEHKYTFQVADLLDYPDCDLLFVDGSSVTRAVGVVNALQRGIETVVFHDSETNWYGYHMIQEYIQMYGYELFEFTDKAPYTSVLTKNKKLINEAGKRYDNH